MDPATAAVCIAAPEWFWFGLLLLFSLFLLVVPSSPSRTYPLTVYDCCGWLNVLIMNIKKAEMMKKRRGKINGEDGEQKR
jgi:hypothetical protein